MRLCVVGGSGPTGRLVLSRAQALGHEVVGVSRHAPEGVGATWVVGDVRDADVARRAVDGADAVISVLGPTDDDLEVCAAGTHALLDAMPAGTRFVCVTGVMVGHPYEHKHGLYRLPERFFGRAVRTILEDRRRQEELVLASDTAWTLVRPPRLTNGPARGAYRVGPTIRIGSFDHISRADLADFLVQCATSDAYLRQAVAIAY